MTSPATRDKLIDVLWDALCPGIRQSEIDREYYGRAIDHVLRHAAMRSAVRSEDAISEAQARYEAQEPWPAAPLCCQCEACQRDQFPHASDCAVHNGPAMPVGSCTCRGIAQEAVDCDDVAAVICASAGNGFLQDCHPRTQASYKIWARDLLAAFDIRPKASPVPSATRATPTWPNGCHDPDSCARHFGCMYVQCPNAKKDGNDLAAEIRAVVISSTLRETP